MTGLSTAKRLQNFPYVRKENSECNINFQGPVKLNQCGWKTF